MRRISIFVLTAVLCACGGGGGSAPAPTAESNVVQLGTAATTVALPVAGGIGGTMSFAALTAPATLQLRASTTPPPGVRLEQGRRRPRDLGTLSVYEYVTIVPRFTIVLPKSPAFLLTFPASIPTTGKSFFYGFSSAHAGDVAATHFDAHGPASIDGQNVGFPADDTALTLAAGQSYTFIIYATYAAPPAPAGPRVYVADANSGNVAIFNADGSPGTPAQFATPASSDVENVAIASDAAGKIYVLRYNFATGTSSLLAYTRDGVATTPVITGLSSDAVAVAVDAAEKIYILSTHVASSASVVRTYAANGAPTTPTITQNLADATSIAVAGNGTIYVLNRCCTFPNGEITTYAPNGTPAALTITIPQNFSYAVAIAVDSSGKLYVENNPQGNPGPLVATFTAQGAPTTPSISARLQASALALDATGKLFVGSGALTNMVNTFLPDGTPTVPTIALPGIYPAGITVR